MAKRTLKLPPILISSKRYSFGYVNHVSFELRTRLEVEGSRGCGDFHLAENAAALTLSNGETVIVTDKRNVVRPNDVDGVLYEYPDGRVRWDSHKLLDSFEKEYGDENWGKLRRDVNASWRDATSYRSERRDKKGYVIEKGLRPPQLGALHAIGAHWSIHSAPATVVMPTGTGKTESMLATLANFIDGTVLVVVPSRALRDQTARKFRTYGLLRELQCLSPSAMNPIVAVLDHRVKDPQEMEVLKHCNVLIATISTVAQGEAVELAKDLAGICSHLVFDEAHHVPADTYSAFRDIFKEKLILQFTATPFRRDGKQLEGKTIFRIR
ncbi:MAG: DEAD/DEAH box helicase family protein [Candidatus Competibacteraceae bacterium]|nr:DEAD/DEAH box helicase family protein [Candidatus Competibacteraceae bacterium]